MEEETGLVVVALDKALVIAGHAAAIEEEEGLEANLDRGGDLVDAQQLLLGQVGLLLQRVRPPELEVGGAMALDERVLVWRRSGN